MAIRIALDTNVLAYAEGLDRAPADAAKIALSHRFLDSVWQLAQRPVLPTQVLAELHRLLIRLDRRSPERASATVLKWQATCETALLGSDGFATALALAADHKLQIFDAMILAAAAEVGCELLVSEDMQDGFVWRGVTVTNLFGERPDPRLRTFLEV